MGVTWYSQTFLKSTKGKTIFFPLCCWLVKSLPMSKASSVSLAGCRTVGWSQRPNFLVRVCVFAVRLKPCTCSRQKPWSSRSGSCIQKSSTGTGPGLKPRPDNSVCLEGVGVQFCGSRLSGGQGDDGGTGATSGAFWLMVGLHGWGLALGLLGVFHQAGGVHCWLGSLFISFLYCPSPSSSPSELSALLCCWRETPVLPCSRMALRETEMSHLHFLSAVLFIPSHLHTSFCPFKK